MCPLATEEVPPCWERLIYNINISGFQFVAQNNKSPRKRGHKGEYLLKTEGQHGLAHWLHT